MPIVNNVEHIWQEIASLFSFAVRLPIKLLPSTATGIASVSYFSSLLAVFLTRLTHSKPITASLPRLAHQPSIPVCAPFGPVGWPFHATGDLYSRAFCRDFGWALFWSEGA